MPQLGLSVHDIRTWVKWLFKSDSAKKSWMHIKVTSSFYRPESHDFLRSTHTQAFISLWLHLQFKFQFWTTLKMMCQDANCLHNKYMLGLHVKLLPFWFTHKIITSWDTHWERLTTRSRQNMGKVIMLLFFQVENITFAQICACASPVHYFTNWRTTYEELYMRVKSGNCRLRPRGSCSNNNKMPCNLSQGKLPCLYFGGGKIVFFSQLWFLLKLSLLLLLYPLHICTFQGWPTNHPLPL